jgi:hypothetical protein
VRHVHERRIEIDGAAEREPCRDESRETARAAREDEPSTRHRKLPPTPANCGPTPTKTPGRLPFAGTPLFVAVLFDGHRTSARPAASRLPPATRVTFVHVTSCPAWLYVSGDGAAL